MFYGILCKHFLFVENKTIWVQTFLFVSFCCCCCCCFFFNSNSVNVSGFRKDWTVLKVYCDKGPALKMTHSELLTGQLKLDKIYGTRWLDLDLVSERERIYPITRSHLEGTFHTPFTYRLFWGCVSPVQCCVKLCCAGRGLFSVNFTASFIGYNKVAQESGSKTVP